MTRVPRHGLISLLEGVAVHPPGCPWQSGAARGAPGLSGISLHTMPVGTAAEDGGLFRGGKTARGATTALATKAEKLVSPGGRRHD
jgi:hypothetical protein